jgi:hypothetical protein
MSLVRLLDIKEAASEIGVPRDSLRKVADLHGKTIIMGRAVKLHPDDIPELIELCRVKPKVPASIGGKGKTDPQSGKSGTPASCQSRPAQMTAQKLKSSSKRTSRGSAAQVVPFNRTK